VRDQAGDTTDQQFRALKKNLAANVRALRLKAGKTQSGLASVLGCEATYVQKLEYGTAAPSLKLLVALALALDVEVAALLQRSGATNKRSVGRPKKSPAAR